MTILKVAFVTKKRSDLHLLYHFMDGILTYKIVYDMSVENTRNWIHEAWESCPRKRFIAASAATVFWNLFSVKARIFAGIVNTCQLD